MQLALLWSKVASQWPNVVSHRLKSSYEANGSGNRDSDSDGDNDTVAVTATSPM